MDNKRADKATRAPKKASPQEFDKDQPSENPGEPLHDRSRADDREGLRRKPKSDSGAIPDLPEPDVEGVGNEGGDHTESTTPPGQGQNPKRNTL